jgi:poly(A) polymerase
MKLKELLKILSDAKESIKAETPFIVGGAVRDKYLNNLSNILDIDITNGSSSINLLSEEFFNKLKENYNVKRKVMSDGHSSVMVGDLKIDFSSNFILNSINEVLEKKNIKNPTNLQKEIYSRDFTCNTLLMTMDLKNIVDPTKQGFNDINKKIIKTCLEPNITLTSNRNRVIRAIYLACKLDFDIDKSIIEYVKKYPNTVKVASQSTLEEKLNTSFEKDSDKASFFINQMNLWDYIPITKEIYPFYLKRKKQ